MKEIVLINILAVFTAGWLNAQQVDERLWDTRRLETVEMTADGANRTYAIEALLTDTYTIEGDFLKIRYSQADTQFDGTYKLIAKNIR